MEQIVVVFVTVMKLGGWRMGVFGRDDFTCQFCYQRGGKLVAHHIKPWSEFSQLRFNVENGITLCEKCHKLILNYKKYEDIG